MPAIYGVRGLDRSRLVELARLNTVPDWWRLMASQLAALMEYERRAERIVHVSPSLVLVRRTRQRPRSA